MTNRRDASDVPLLCRLGLHKPVPSKLWNDGFYFTACSRCRQYMIRKPGGRWQLVPKTLKVVWRERGPDDIVWPTHVM